jgi:hypothetical protein
LKSRRVWAVALAALAGGLLAAGCASTAQEPLHETSQTHRIEPMNSASNNHGDTSSEVHAGDGGASATTRSGSNYSSAQSGSGRSSSTVSQSSNDGISDFSGTGPTTVSFHVDRPSRLAWTAAGERFSVEGAGIRVDSGTGIGHVPLEPGDYNGVRIEGGGWTVVVKPR